MGGIWDHAGRHAGEFLGQAILLLITDGMPSSEEEPSPEVSPIQMLFGSAIDFASQNPPLAMLITLGLAFFIANKLRSSAGTIKVGGSSGDRNAAMLAARERQQSALAAAEARRATYATVPVATAVEQAQAPAAPAAEARDQMPARMRAALERKDAAARAEARMRGEPAPTPSAPPREVAPPTPAPAPRAAPSAPAASTSNASGKRKETMTEKLARIERGKGPSAEFNPLHGSSGGSSFKPSSKKKGG